MKLIIGLGNPGKRYQRTRHNVGFMVVEELKIRWAANSLFSLSPKFKSLILPVSDSKKKLILVKPQTYMNNSGEAVAALANFYKVEVENIWVIHDDIDLPLGKLRIRIGGGNGGHRGVESIIGHLRTEEFIRFRLGIGKEVESEKLTLYQNKYGTGTKVKSNTDTTEFVLSLFEEEEKEKASQMIKMTVEAVQLALEKGIEMAMNRYNRIRSRIAAKNG